MTTTTDRVALLVDVLGHDDTELFGQPRLWRHRDGRFLTDDEVDIVADITVGDIRHAMELVYQELLHMKEQDELRAEFIALIARPRHPGEPIIDVVNRLPKAKQYRAAELWQRIGPEFEASWRAQS